MASKTVYCGNLPADVRRSEVEDLFGKYGRIRDVDLKVPTRPPAFAFVEFDSSRDAEDAVKGRDGYDFDGNRLRVEIAQGGGRRGGGFGMGARGFGGGFGGPPPFMGGRGGGFGGGNRGGVSRRTGYRLVVSGLPESASWQDLKDTCRRYGDVTFTQVMRDNRDRTMGIVDYATREDMKYALRKLDDSEFRNPFAKCYIRVKEDREGGRSRSRSRSYSRSRSRGRSSSRSRSRSYSRSRSRSSRSRSRSSSRSRSRSRSKSHSKSRSRSRSGTPAKSRSRTPPAAGTSPVGHANGKGSPVSG